MSSSKTSTIPKIDNTQSASTSKQSIPQPINAQSSNNHSNQTAHLSQHHSHLPLHAQQKSHGIPSIIPQAQKRHLVPPRYQEPPPVQSGILKHNPAPRSGIPTLNNHQSNHLTDLNAPLNINLKFPQEVPKLTSVYIPDRNSGNPSRIATARSLQPSRQSLNSQPSPQSAHLSTDDEQPNSSNRPVATGHPQDMLKFVRKSEADTVPAHSPNPNSQAAANLIRMNAAEQNRHFQSLLAELRSLKEVNQRLSDDNQELRDLCCFLDDDRQKGRKLAREWQRFGRYTASVMRQEVSAYQSKLRQLDDKQQELIRDNLELKELCLYLDEERANLAASIPNSCSHCGTSIRANGLSATSNALRDDGDGSSSSTNDEPMPSARQFNRPVMDPQVRSALNDQTLQYVRSLERRIQEHENTANSNRNNVEIPTNIPPPNPSVVTKSMIPTPNASVSSKSSDATNTVRSTDILSGRPEAVVRALQILEVREQLERDRAVNPSSMSPEHMDDGEKALLREMCNVVWRKLEENPNNQDQ